MRHLDISIRKTMYVVLVASIYLLSACQKTEDPLVDNPDDFLVFGRFYGFCMGEKCIEIYRLQDGKVFEDSKDQYVSNESFYLGDFQVLDDKQFKAVKDLWNSIPQGIYEEDQIRFGCPDCADQGGIYFEIRTGAFHEYWIMDQDKSGVPDYLHVLMDSINSKIDFLSNQ